MPPKIKQILYFIGVGVGTIAIIGILLVAAAPLWIPRCDDFYTPDLTGQIVNRPGLPFTEIINGDLACAFGPKTFSQLMIRKKFAGYRANRFWELEHAGYWSISVIDHRKKSITTTKVNIDAVNVTEQINGYGQCGRTLTVRPDSTTSNVRWMLLGSEFTLPESRNWIERR